MNFSFFIGLLTTVISGVLAALVLWRWRSRGGAHLLLWGVGLTLYCVSGIAETVLALTWSDLAFRIWYWTGALMIPPALGHGTLHLLARKKEVVAVLDAALAVIALASLMWVFSVALDPSKFSAHGDIGKFLTESYRQILPESPIRKILPPILNGWGTVLLAGGAVYSAYLFLRKAILPNRVLGNVFIALGGVLPAFAGVLLKLAESVPALSSTAATVKYLTILLSALLLFIGFQLAISGAPKK